MRNKSARKFIDGQLKSSDVYRCSCCDELKKASNSSYALWDGNVLPANSAVVVICRKCLSGIKKSSLKGVKQFLELK